MVLSTCLINEEHHEAVEILQNPDHRRPGKGSDGNGGENAPEGQPECVENGLPETALVERDQGEHIAEHHQQHKRGNGKDHIAPVGGGDELARDGDVFTAQKSQGDGDKQHGGSGPEEMEPEAFKEGFYGLNRVTSGEFQASIL